MAREVTIKFLGDESDLTKSSRKASSDLDDFGKKAGRTAGVAAAATTAVLHAAASGARAVAGFMKGAIGEAEESAQMGRVTARLIKTTGGAAKVSAKHIATYSQSLSNITGIDDEVIQGAQNVLLTFKQVRNEAGAGNDVFDRATKLGADLAAVLGGDLKSQTLLLGKALADPTKGLGKLQKAGVNFTESQKNQIKVLQASGDILGAQKIILGEVEHQVGGAAEANATATQKMATAWANFKESIGTIVLPAFTAIVDWLIKVVLPAVESFAQRASDALAPWFKTLGELAHVAIDKTLTALDKLGKWARDNADALTVAAAALGTFAGALGAMGAAKSASSAVASLGSSVMSLAAAAGPYGLIAAAIIAIGVGAYVAYQKFKPFHDFIDATWQLMQEWWDWVITAINWQAIVDGAITAWNTIYSVISTVVNAVMSVVNVAGAFIASVWQRYGDEITGILTALAELFAAIWNRIVEVVTIAIALLTPLFTVLVTAFKVAFQVISTTAQVFVVWFQLMWDVFGRHIVDAMRIAWAVLAGVIEGALRIIKGIINVATALISGDWGKAWEGIKSIASGAWKIITSIFAGAIEWLKVTWATVTDLITKPFSAAKDALSKIFSGFAGIISTAFDGAVSALKSSINALIDIINAAIRAYNKIPLAPDIPTINPVGASAAAASYGYTSGVQSFAARRTAPIGYAAYAPAPVPMRAAPIVINLPDGVNGHSVIDAVRRYESHNGRQIVTTGAGWHRR